MGRVPGKNKCPDARSRAPLAPLPHGPMAAAGKSKHSDPQTYDEFFAGSPTFTLNSLLGNREVLRLNLGDRPPKPAENPTPPRPLPSATARASTSESVDSVDADPDSSSRGLPHAPSNGQLGAHYAPVAAATAVTPPPPTHTAPAAPAASTAPPPIPLCRRVATPPPSAAASSIESSTALTRYQPEDSHDDNSTTAEAPRPRPDRGTCPVCRKFFRHDLRGHVISHRGNWMFDCKFSFLNLCGDVKIVGPTHAKKHMLIRHFRYYDLTLHGAAMADLLEHYGECACGWRGSGERWIEHHVLDNQCKILANSRVNVPVSSAWKCSTCNCLFATRYALEMHQSKHETIESLRMKCNFASLGKCGCNPQDENSAIQGINHLLSRHFQFDVNLDQKRLSTKGLLDREGTCECGGYHGVAHTWFYYHVLSPFKPCPLVTDELDPTAPTEGHCSVCGVFLESDLQQHIKSHCNDWTFDCPFSWFGKCGLFDGKTNCKVHMFATHFEYYTLRFPDYATLSTLYAEKGRCSCGFQGTGAEWMNNHIFTLEDQCLLVVFAAGQRHSQIER